MNGAEFVAVVKSRCKARPIDFSQSANERVTVFAADLAILVSMAVIKSEPFHAFGAARQHARPSMHGPLRSREAAR